MPPKLAAIFNRPRQDTPVYIASFCRIESNRALYISIRSDTNRIYKPKFDSIRFVSNRIKFEIREFDRSSNYNTLFTYDYCQ
jgi:hypothetical protein